MPEHAPKWYRTPLDRELLAELNQRSDAKGFLQAGGYLATAVATGALALAALAYTPMPWTVPAVLGALFLHGTVMAFLPNAVHELVHGTVFRTPWLNTLFVHVFAFFGWNNHHRFWASHAEHHKYTLHAPDDLEVVLPQSHSLKAFLLHGVFSPNLLWPLQTVREQVRLIAGRFGGDRPGGEWEAAILPPEAKDKRRKVRLWAAAMLAGHGAILGVSVWQGWWLLPVLTSLTPMYGCFLFYFCNNMQHAGLVDLVADFRLCCRTMYLNPVFRFLYWHMNYHIEHHMYAGVPCYNLAKLHRAVEHDLPPTPNGLVETWSQILHIQTTQKKFPDFQYAAPLPGTNPMAGGLQPVKSVKAGQKAAAADPTLNPGPGAGSKEGPDAVAAPARAALNSRGEAPRVWECSVCGFVYDEALGLEEEGFAPGLAWADIPDDWTCPDCGVAKADFHMVEVTGQAGKAASAEMPEKVGAAPEAAPAPAPAPGAADAEPLVIVGSGLAGYAVVKELRALGDRRPVTVLTEGDGAVYSKPMLSNALARGLDPAALARETAEAFGRRHGVEVRAHTEVLGIDREEKVVRTAGGGVPYGKLLLAVGADQVQLPLKGSAAGRVHRVNDLSTYAGFRGQLPASGGRVLLIGGGLIGCEFANDLAAAGHEVHVVDLAPAPLAALVPTEVGRLLADRLGAAGVRWHPESTVASVDGEETGEIRCTLTTGEELAVDVVLSAVGLRPRTKLAAEAGLGVGRGIQVDALHRTGDPHVFALGDCAEVDGQVRPYLAPLFEGARAIAATLAGERTAAAFPVTPVTVKTPALPLVVCPPAPGTEGAWVVQGDAPDLTAMFNAPGGGLPLGFVLTGSAVREKDEAVRTLSAAVAGRPAATAATPA